MSDHSVGAIDRFSHQATAENRALVIMVRPVQRAPRMFATSRALEDYLPADLQVKAAMHFTPPALARVVARLLAPEDGAVVLDVGAGPGLFCVAAALVTPHARFVGVEWRARLVDVANDLASRTHAYNASFVFGDAIDLDWSAYDAFYLYNPFAEYTMQSQFVIDRSVDLDAESYVPYVEGVQNKLAVAPMGTRVVTYHGFGGELSTDYVRATHLVYGSDRIELWVKTR